MPPSNIYHMRIVAVSDLHGHLPEIPPCDLLIVAGDICPDRFGPFLALHDPPSQRVWFDQNVRPWLAASPATHKLLTWGNHDWCGQMCDFSADSPSRARSTDLQILVDEGAAISQKGDAVSVWATPWSNKFMLWAFMRHPSDLADTYAAIPVGVDVLVSHQPPWSYGDRVPDGHGGRARHVGSRELLEAIDRVRPRVVICGHIHRGFGRYEHQGIPVFNVSVVDETYKLVNPPTVIDLPDR